VAVAKAHVNAFVSPSDWLRGRAGGLRNLTLSKERTCRMRLQIANETSASRFSRVFLPRFPDRHGPQNPQKFPGRMLGECR
jgi:hypothetical protein